MKLSQLPVDMARHISTFTSFKDLSNLSGANKSIRDDLNYELDRRKKEFIHGMIRTIHGILTILKCA